MARPKRPLILVQTNPIEVNIGQPLTISARLFDINTNQPMTVSRIYMNIVSKKDGHVVWPLEVIRKNTDKFDIQIGTSMMKEGHEYFLRVSNNWNMSPNGAATFKVHKDTTVPLAIFPIPIPEREPVDDLKRREIEKFIFRTQMDHRVCPICKEVENQVFAPNEPKPIIPLHFNCRCTYDVVFNDLEQLNASFDEIREIVMFSRLHRQFRMQREEQVLKIINVLDRLDESP